MGIIFGHIEYAATGKEIRETFYNTKDSGGVKPTVVEYDENEKQIKNQNIILMEVFTVGSLMHIRIIQ